MKQKLTKGIIVGASLLLAANPVSAQLVNCGRRGQNPCQLNDIFSTGAAIVSFLLGASFLVSITFIVIGGIRMIFSAGNPKLIETGKQTLFNAILGLIIVLAAYLIINVVLTKLSGGTITLTNINDFLR